jgi:hypothetical protein
MGNFIRDKLALEGNTNNSDSSSASKKKQMITLTLKLIKDALHKKEHETIKKGLSSDKEAENGDKESFLNGNRNNIRLYYYDLWDMTPEARRDYKDILADKIAAFIKDINKGIKDKDFYVETDGDWDTGWVSLFYKRK